MSLIEEILTMTEAEESCLAKGGSLALLSTDYIMDYATKILMYYDYDKAWSINSNTGGMFLVHFINTLMDLPPPPINTRSF